MVVYHLIQLYSFYRTNTGTYGQCYGSGIPDLGKYLGWQHSNLKNELFLDHWVPNWKLKSFLRLLHCNQRYLPGSGFLQKTGSLTLPMVLPVNTVEIFVCTRYLYPIGVARGGAGGPRPPPLEVSSCPLSWPASSSPETTFEWPAPPPLKIPSYIYTWGPKLLVW